MIAIFWMNRVDPSISLVVKFLTRPSKNFLLSRTDISHSRRIRRYNKKDFRDVLRQLAKHFLPLLQGVLCSSALGDIDENDCSTKQEVVLTYWIGPILNRKARSVGAPDDFVVHVGTLAPAKSRVNMAIVVRVRRSIWASMMHYAVHLLTDELE